MTTTKTMGALIVAVGMFCGCGQNGASAPETTAAANEKIAWLTSYDTALAQAKQQNKPVLIDFFATWCGPCKMMDKQTYTEAAVQNELTNWVAVKIDVDKNPKLSQQYNVTGIPMTVLLDANGKTITSETGYLDAKQFVEFVQTSRPAAAKAKAETGQEKSATQ